MVSRCVLTPVFNKLLIQPEEFSRTNNLYKKVGSFETAIGQKVMIVGRLMDKNCVPINQGVMRFWQVDDEGQISYKVKGGGVKSIGDKNFVGSGVANSDNMGRFIIFTIVPGKSLEFDNARNINVQVTADKKLLKTKLFFDRREAENDTEFNVLDDHAKNSVLLARYHGDFDGVIYFVDIVMDYAQNNRTY